MIVFLGPLLFVIVEIILVFAGVLHIEITFRFDDQFLQAAIEAAFGILRTACPFWLLYNGPVLDSLLLSSILLAGFAAIGH